MLSEKSKSSCAAEGECVPKGRRVGLVIKCKSSPLSHAAVPHLLLLHLPSVRELPQKYLLGP